VTYSVLVYHGLFSGTGQISSCRGYQAVQVPPASPQLLTLAKNVDSQINFLSIIDQHETDIVQ
jgi:hypothetical protein